MPRPRPRPRPPLAVGRLEDRATPAVAYALTDDNAIIPFDTDNPQAALPPVAVTGLGSGEELVGLDVRPQTGGLYGLAFTSAGGGAVRLYAISPRTGRAGAVGGPVQFTDAAGGPVAVTGSAFGFDFNPTVDRIRVVTDTGLNFRMDPNTGLLIDGNNGSDAAVDGVNPDGAINRGAAPTPPADTAVSGAAYTNSSPNATATTQYVLNAETDQLSIQNPPNAGLLPPPTSFDVTVGGAKLDFVEANGFDIPAGVEVASGGATATGTGFAVLAAADPADPTAAGPSKLYAIDLANGKASAVGTVGDGSRAIRGLAVTSPALPAVLLSADGTQLSRYPGLDKAPVTVPVVGVAEGEALVGLDYRPLTGQLFALGVNAAADNATLYRIDPQAKAADGTPAAKASPVAVGIVEYRTAAGGLVDLPAAGDGFGFDVNPVADAVRVTSALGLNARVEVEDTLSLGTARDGDFGGPANSVPGTNPDADLKAGGSSAVVAGTATAYTNSFGGATATTQYTFDSAADKLYIQSPPNAGTLLSPSPDAAAAGGRPVTVGGAAVDVGGVSGFDIPAGVRVAASGDKAAGRGYAAFAVGGVTKLYAVDLATAAATALADAPAGGAAGLAVGDAPVGAVGFEVAAKEVVESAGTAKLTVVRTGGTVGGFTAKVSVAAGGTATAGTDFKLLTDTVTFADGQATATVDVQVTADAAADPGETFTLLLSDPTDGAVLGANTAAKVTLTDAPVVAFAAPQFAASEAAGKAVLTLSRTGDVAAAATVELQFSDGDAKRGVDFNVSPPAVATFPAGKAEATFEVQLPQDAVVEGPRSFQVTLSGPTGGAVVGSPGTATVTITDPPVGAVSFAPDATAVTVAEDVAGGKVRLRLVRDGRLGLAGEFPVAVSLKAGGTAALGGDFGPLPAQVVFADGQQEAFLEVPIADDGVTEPPETFTVTIAATAAGGTVAERTEATVTITDPVVQVGFPAAALTVSERAGKAVLTLARTGRDAGAFEVGVAVRPGGTATAGTDFGPLSATTVAFAAGQQSATVEVPITADNVAEGDESFTVELRDPTAGVVLSDVPAVTVTIRDEPTGAVAFQTAGASVSENAGSVTLTLTRTGGASGAFQVTVGVTGGTAKAGVDFGPVPATVSFADGQSTATLVIPVLSDALTEGEETFTVALTDPTNGATLGGLTAATVSIRDEPPGAGKASVTPASLPAPQFAVGADAGGGTVRVYNPDQTVRFTATPFGGGFTGGVRTAVADVNGDGTPDLIAATGPGVNPRVVVLDGNTQAELFAVSPFEATFGGGAFVAAADLNGDNKAEVVVTPDQGGGPRVQVYDGSTFRLVANYFGVAGLDGRADDGFRGGARVALSDLSGDGTPDVVVAAGFGGGPRVTIWDGASVAAANGGRPGRNPVANFFAFENTLRNGTFVSAGDVTGDGVADLAAGGGPGGGPRVRVIDGKGLLAAGEFGSLDNKLNLQVANFFGGDPNNRGGIRLAVKRLDADPFADLVVGAGEGAGGRATGYLGRDLATNNATAAFNLDALPGFGGGVFVG